MQNKFNRIIREMCHYYSCRGKSMSVIAEEIGISKRTLQHWKNNYLPRRDSLTMLKSFLEENEGGQFLVQLNGITLPADEDDVSSNTGKFPHFLGKDDISAIREAFPKGVIFQMLCAMVVFGNYPEAIRTVIPDAGLQEMAALIARYEAAMQKAADAFGIANIYDWKNKIICYIPLACTVNSDFKIEQLGQTVVDNVTACYLMKNGKEELVKKENVL